MLVQRLHLHAAAAFTGARDDDALAAVLPYKLCGDLVVVLVAAQPAAIAVQRIDGIAVAERIGDIGGVRITADGAGVRRVSLLRALRRRDGAFPEFVLAALPAHGTDAVHDGMLARGGDDVVFIRIAADGAEIGGIAVFAAGGGRDRRVQDMPDGGDLFRIRIIAAGAGVCILASPGTGRVHRDRLLDVVPERFRRLAAHGAASFTGIVDAARSRTSGGCRAAHLPAVPRGGELLRVLFAAAAAGVYRAARRCTRRVGLLFHLIIVPERRHDLVGDDLAAAGARFDQVAVLQAVCLFLRHLYIVAELRAQLFCRVLAHRIVGEVVGFEGDVAVGICAADRLGIAVLVDIGDVDGADVVPFLQSVRQAHGDGAAELRDVASVHGDAVHPFAVVCPLYLLCGDLFDGERELVAFQRLDGFVVQLNKCVAQRHFVRFCQIVFGNDRFGFGDDRSLCGAAQRTGGRDRAARLRAMHPGMRFFVGIRFLLRGAAFGAGQKPHAFALAGGLLYDALCQCMCVRQLRLHRFRICTARARAPARDGDGSRAPFDGRALRPFHCMPEGGDDLLIRISARRTGEDARAVLRAGRRPQFLCICMRLGRGQLDAACRADALRTGGPAVPAVAQRRQRLRHRITAPLVGTAVDGGAAFRTGIFFDHLVLFQCVGGVLRDDAFLLALAAARSLAGIGDGLRFGAERLFRSDTIAPCMTEGRYGHELGIGAALAGAAAQLFARAQAGGRLDLLALIQYMCARSGDELRKRIVTALRRAAVQSRTRLAAGSGLDDRARIQSMARGGDDLRLRISTARVGAAEQPFAFGGAGGGFDDLPCV